MKRILRVEINAIFLTSCAPSSSPPSSSSRLIARAFRALMTYLIKDLLNEPKYMERTILNLKFGVEVHEQKNETL
jgi:hypothetical protein